VEPGQADPQTSGRADEDLLAAIKQGDAAALAELYDRHGRLALALADRLLQDRAAAEDVVQEAFLTVWRRAGSYLPDRGRAQTWLMTIVHNAAIDRRRGRFRREAADLPLDNVAYELAADAADPFVAVADRIEAEQVRLAVNQLPAEQRETIELAYFGGLTHQEIAERTGAPLGTIKSRMRLGLHKLRGVLADQA